MLYQTSREPKSLELEKTEDGRLRLVLTVSKLGMVTAVEYFLEPQEAQLLGLALTNPPTPGP